MSKKKNSKEKKMPGEFKERVVVLGNDNYRRYLQGTYGYALGSLGEFKGKVLIFEEAKILFKYLDVCFELGDGSFIEGKEDHVWIYDTKPFREAGIHAGDCVSFTGEVYAYKRADNSRDYGIKNCDNIEKIDGYELPSNEYLEEQFYESLVCDITCMYKDLCYGMCIAPDGYKEGMTKQILEEHRKRVSQFA